MSNRPNQSPEISDQNVPFGRDWGDVTLLCVILMFSLLVCVIFSVKGGSSNPVETPGSSSGIVWDENAESGGIMQRSEEEIRAELNEKVEQGMINISMNLSPIFPDGESEGDLLIVNSERNNYPQIVYIVRKDTGEEIYRSGGIPVGSKIEYAKLGKSLPAGTYDCIAYFNNVDETGSFLGTAGAEVVVTVQN